MKHLREGQLRAFYDGAVNRQDGERIRRHLAMCTRCARMAAAIEERGTGVQTVLSSIDSQSERVPVSAQVARHRLSGTLARKQGRIYAIRKENVMLKNVFSGRKLFSRQFRPVWAVVAVVLVFATAFAFQPVRTLAGDLLALFRVQKIQFVEVDPSNIPDDEALEAMAGKLESVLQDQVEFRSDGEPQDVDVTTARSMAGFVRFPTAIEATPRVTVKPGTHLWAQIDLPRIRALLDELGYEAKLPDEIDGAEVSVDFDTLVMATYGACRSDEIEGEYDPAKCQVLIQMPSPAVEAPSELDIDQLGRAYLQLLGMSESEARRFSERVDWTTTLVVPVPQSTNLSYQEVSVDGVAGTWVSSLRRGQRQYALTWIKGDVVYGLTGVGTLEDALEIANSLQ
ncbi:MAG: hypothetical protein JXA89_05400 [Anaerolineae bacterium]|nr:hypothetical protein [Anaerolineae bacterium]